MREYCESDYGIVLEAARQAGACEITPIAAALLSSGVRWPNLSDPADKQAAAVDRDICRAWCELGYHA